VGSSSLNIQTAGPGGPHPPRAEPSAVAKREARSDEPWGWGPAALMEARGERASTN